MPGRSTRFLCPLLACAMLAACGDAGDATDAAESASVATSAPGPAVVDGVRALLPAGEFQVWVDSGGRVTAFANQVERGALLAALSERAGFELAVGSEARLGDRLDLQSEGEPLEVALARVLGGVPHAIEYAHDLASGEPHLARLRVGGADWTAAAGEPAPRVRGRKRRSRTPEEETARAERVAQMRAESLASLESSDPEVRSDGVRWVDVNTSEGFTAAMERLANDESAEVRAAAAEALIEGDVGAVQPLLQALDDPDQRVVLAALDALEFVGDETTVPHLEPLLKHRDVEIRERTVEAIEFLQ